MSPASASQSAGARADARSVARTDEKERRAARTNEVMQIDDDTAVPNDLFVSLLAAGERAHMRGQHVEQRRHRCGSDESENTNSSVPSGPTETFTVLVLA